MQTIRVANLRELEDACAASGLCFRGQRDARWRLVPTAYRALLTLPKGAKVDYSQVSLTERDTYREFDMKSRQLMTERFPELLELVAVAQHHGVPTRYLDWTTDCRVAAYFATSSSSGADAAVWSLDLTQFPFPPQLGRQHRGHGFPISKVLHYSSGHRPSFAQEVSVTVPTFTAAPQPSGPPAPPPTFVVVQPPAACSRLLSQKGLLSWYHGFDDDQFEWDYTRHILRLERRHKLQLLMKIILPKAAIADIRSQLRRADITPFSIFPDLDGLGRHLSEIHDADVGLSYF